MLIFGYSASTFYNWYKVGLAEYKHIKLLSESANISASKEEFYCSGIDDGIQKPSVLGEEPNIVLIFVEGFSENIIMDERDIVPNIKKFAQEAIQFKNYYNHTFPTLRGLIGQLYSGYQLDNMDVNLLPSLQSILENKGYYTTFINTEPCDQDFTQYLNNLGFDEVLTDEKQKSEESGDIYDKQAFELLYDTIDKQSVFQKSFLTAIYTFGTHVSFDSPDEKFKDGKDPLLNKFYNMDYQFGQFIEKFKKNKNLDNTLLILTTDHATYGEEDFAHSFPNYHRERSEIDNIPFFLYHKDITPQIIDVQGRNSLGMAPTVLDYLDITTENCFLGKSLFVLEDASKGQVDCNTKFYDNFYYLSSADGKIRNLDKDEYLEFSNLLMKYFNIKGQANDYQHVVSRFAEAVVSKEKIH